ncbi:hypothetical protein [Pseudoalteromonas sp.]|uniref:hypothetical protein n=1 Tax=Pseudoalteromonas sp. TaxID=53249 RepID=UPI0035652D2A
MNIHTLSFELAEIEPYILGRLMCVKSEITAQLIKRVNKQIESLNQQGELLRVHLDYYPNKLHSLVTRYLTKGIQDG